MNIRCERCRKPVASSSSATLDDELMPAMATTQSRSSSAVTQRVASTSATALTRAMQWSPHDSFVLLPSHTIPLEDDGRRAELDASPNNLTSSKSGRNNSACISQTKDVIIDSSNDSNEYLRSNDDAGMLQSKNTNSVMKASSMTAHGNVKAASVNMASESGISAPIWSRLMTVSTVADTINAPQTSHALCVECTRLLTSMLDKQVKDIKLERDCYNEFMKQSESESLKIDQTTNTMTASTGSEMAEVLSAHPMDDDDEEKKLYIQLSALDEQEQQALAELADLERQEAELNAEAKRWDQESRELDEMEALYWASFNAFQLDLQAFMNKRDGLNAKYSFAGRQLEKLKRTNVYNDAFRIWHEGHFGTINGLRLGRLSHQPVDWVEINAAWGQACLLLDTLAKKLNFTFSGYKLMPLGSYSKVEKLSQDKGVYELFNTTDLHLGRLFFNRRFDVAMVSFLTCLSQLGDYCESLDDDFRLPYRIVKERIGDVSIRLPFNQDEMWTKACRYMLTNCKWILAFVTKRDLGR